MYGICADELPCWETAAGALEHQTHGTSGSESHVAQKDVAARCWWSSNWAAEYIIGNKLAVFYIHNSNANGLKTLYRGAVWWSAALCPTVRCVDEVHEPKGCRETRHVFCHAQRSSARSRTRFTLVFDASPSPPLVHHQLLIRCCTRAPGDQIVYVQSVWAPRPCARKGIKDGVLRAFRCWQMLCNFTTWSKETPVFITTHKRWNKCKCKVS